MLRVATAVLCTRRLWNTLLVLLACTGGPCYSAGSLRHCAARNAIFVRDQDVMKSPPQLPAEAAEAQAQQLTRSVAKAFRILESFSEREPRHSFAELCAEVDFAPSTMRRLLSTMESLGYLQHDSHGQYHLGPRALALAPAALAASDIRNQALPVLDELSRITGLNANLGVLYEGKLLYLACVSTNLPRRRYFGVPGRLAAIQGTAMGKVLLAYLPEEAARRVVEKGGGLVARTARTITKWEDLVQELARVREREYAIDDEEVVEGGLCLAAPVRDRSGQVVAALSASGMTWEIDRRRMSELAEAVTGQAETLSFKLGLAFAIEW